MHIRRALQLLVLGLSAASVADATILNPRLVRDGNALQPRQDTDDGDSNATPTNEPPATTPTAPPTTPTAPTTPPAENTSTTSRSTSAPDATPTPSTPGGGTPEPTPTPSPPSRTSSSKTSSTTAPPDKSQTREPVTETITTVVTSTNADGSKATFTSEILTTTTPDLAKDGSNNDSGKGLTKGERNTIIGVVVGVGGAIVLGGLAFVAFRVWGRKKHQEENEELMDYTSTGIAEKPDGPGSQSGRSPFQSTLESYHAPGQVNTASNF